VDGADSLLKESDSEEDNRWDPTTQWSCWPALLAAPPDGMDRGARREPRTRRAV